jgi:hypothetical protein
MTAIVIILLVAAVLALFVPLAASRPAPDYYRSDDSEGENQRKRKRLKGMLIDLRQEFDSGKMSEEEFLSIAGPLSAEMEALEKASAHVRSSPGKKKDKRILCPGCGLPNAKESTICSRCATVLGEIS